MANAKGHLDQERQNLRSTKLQTIPGLEQHELFPDAFPDKENKCSNCFAVIIPAPEKGISYSDQTGRFPIRVAEATNTSL